MELMWTFAALKLFLCVVSTLTPSPRNEPTVQVSTGTPKTQAPATGELESGDDGHGMDREEDTMADQTTSLGTLGNEITTPGTSESTAFSSIDSVTRETDSDGLNSQTTDYWDSDAPGTAAHQRSPVTAPLSGPNATVPGDTTAAADSDSELIPIYLGGYFSFGGGWEGSGLLPACQMALEHINQRPDVLPGYDLRMIWNDTQCEPGLGTRVFFDQLHRQPQKIMIIGPPCSPASQIMAGTAHFWNLIAMSYSAASPGLSNREKYPLFYRTYMPDAMFNPARIRLMREFGWTRVATIHENHEVFSLAIDDLLTLLKAANITIISSESFSEDPKNQIENLKSQDAKIIIGNMYANKARRVFCEAYKQGMTGANHVWMIIGWYRDKWWLEPDATISCSTQEMTLAVEGAHYISMESLPLSTSEEPTIAGITPAEYELLYQERMTWPENRGYIWNSLGTYGYDAAWAIALALNKSVGLLKTKRFSDGSTRRLEDFTYDDSEMAELFFNLLNETEFDGVSGPVGFRRGDRVGITQIEQLQAACPEEWRIHRSSCFQFVARPVLPSAEARAHCAAAGPGVTLAHLDSEEEHAFLLNSWNSSLKTLGDKWFITVSTGLSGATTTPWIPTDTSVDVMQTGACVCVDFQKGGKLQTTDCSVPLPFICRAHAEFSEKQVALYNAIDDTLEWRKNFTWSGDGPPLDRTPVVIKEVVRRYQGVTPLPYFCICGVATFCIVASLFFLLFNIKYRQQRHVKMSSPNLNNLIIAGAMLVYVYVILAGLDTNLVSEDVFGILCHVKTWNLSVGFVLAFGAMFSKTWRVHRVAAFKTPKRRIVTDGQLFIIVFVLLLIDVVILILWQVIDPVKVQTLDLYPQPDTEAPNRIIQPYVRFCTCDNLTYWLGALYAYKGVLLIFGTFLAWETRKVSIPGLNDSKLIGVSVYNVVILCLVGVAISVVIGSEPEALYLIVSCIILFCTSITLIVVFVPKIITVVKYPDGDPSKSAVSGKRTKTISNHTSSSTTSGFEAENAELRNRIRELERQLEELRGRGRLVSLPGNGKGCGCWSCGLVCGFSPSRAREYSKDSITRGSQLEDAAVAAGSSTATNL